MPPRSRGRSSAVSAKKTVVPATQAAPGPSSVASRATSCGGDPLAMTPARPSSPPARRSSRRSVRVAQGIPSSSPSIAALARGKRGRGREDEELVKDGDVVPPSDDDEYDEWKDVRRAELKEREEGNTATLVSSRIRKPSEPTSASSSGEAGVVKPKKPGKAQDPPQTPSFPIPRERHTFVSLFSPVPSNVPSTSSPTSSPAPYSGQTTPTLPFSSHHGQEDPFLPSQGKVVQTNKEYSVDVVEAWDGEDDELDLLALGKEMAEDNSVIDGGKTGGERAYPHRESGEFADKQEEEEGQTLGRWQLPTSNHRPQEVSVLSLSSPGNRAIRFSTFPHKPSPSLSRQTSFRDSRSPTPATLPVLRNDFDETVPLGITPASAPSPASVAHPLSWQTASRSPTPEAIPPRVLGAGYRSPIAAPDRSDNRSATPETMPLTRLGKKFFSPGESSDRSNGRSLTPETLPLRRLGTDHGSPSQLPEPTSGASQSAMSEITLRRRYEESLGERPEEDEGGKKDIGDKGEEYRDDIDDETVGEKALEGIDFHAGSPVQSPPSSFRPKAESKTPQKSSWARDRARVSLEDDLPASAVPLGVAVISRTTLPDSQLSHASLSTYALSPHRSPTPQAIAFARSAPMYLEDDLPMQFDDYDDHLMSRGSAVEHMTPRLSQTGEGSMPPPSLPRSAMAKSPAPASSSSPPSPFTPRRSQSPHYNNRRNPSPSRFSTLNPPALRTSHNSTNRAPVSSSPATNLSPAFAAIAHSSPAAPAPAPTTSPFPIIPPDPELEQFRTARTFRTRTIVQLQPYTKERQIYEAQLRQGGLKKARRPIPIGSRTHGTEDEDDVMAQARVSESSEATVSDSSSAEEVPSASGMASGERIVIGNTPPPRVPRPPRALIPLVDVDFDEYFFGHGVAADETDEKCMKELQKIARVRLKAEKEKRRRERDAERERKRFERLVKDMDKEIREKEKAERNKQRAARDKERAEREREGGRQRERKRERARVNERRKEKGKVKDRAKGQTGHEDDAESRTQDKNFNKWMAELKGNLSDLETEESEDSMDGTRGSTPVAQAGARDMSIKKRDASASKNRAIAKRTPGGTKTYASKDRNRQLEPISIDSDSDSSAPRLRLNRPARTSVARRVVSPARSDATVTPSFQTAVSRQGDNGIGIGGGGGDSNTGDYDMGGWPDGFDGYDDGDHGGFDHESPAPAPPPHSFIVDDMLGPTRRRRPARSKSGSDSNPRSNSQASDDGASPPAARSSSPPVNDPKFKVARRVMPAVMLRRLEKDAKEKERQAAERKRREREARKREQRSASPVRPGKAVIRRGAGAGTAAALDQLAGFFTDGEGDSSAPEEEMPRPGPATSSMDYPILVMDESDSSEAVEDNYEQSLAQLHRGDFEGLAAGRRRDEAGRKKKAGKERERPHGRGHRDGVRGEGGDGSTKAKRPALGLVKRVRAPGGGEDRQDLRQTRLDFPASDKPGTDSVKKRKRKQGAAPHQRPAIRLDDHVIFAVDEFEFDSPNEGVDRPSPAAKVRTFGRTESTRSTVMGGGVEASPGTRATAQDVLDVGMGKARSWANFDKFPIDFGISPLPSGLYCHPQSIPGSGSLVTFASHLLEPLVGGAGVELDLVREYEIELEAGMTPGSIVEVLDIIFDAIHHRLIAIVNNSTNEELSVSPLEWLGAYVTARRDDIDEGIGGLRVALQEAVQSLTGKLNEVVVVYSRHNQSARDAILNLRWALFELSCRVSARDVTIGDGSQAKEIPLVQDCATALLKQLLSLGFDKTIRPLKLILRGESESPEINDTSITIWIALLHGSSAWDARSHLTDGTTFLSALNRAIDSTFHLDRVGPIAAERIWFLVFGLCALSQFDEAGEIHEFLTIPRWSLVRRAMGLIKVAFDEKAEVRAGAEQLQGRDRYIKVMVARCVRLSAVWKWSFNRESFSVVTRDLGKIFKDRQYRNLPTEPPVDYPSFIARFDMSLTAAGDTKRETVFELYLRLVCVAASDVILAAQSLSEAQQAEKDVRRLVITTIPVNPVKFDRLFPPTPQELGQLINRFSTMIAACYFSPSLLGHLLANYKTWSVFQQAPFDSRQIVIRGFMYLAVACRHHRQPLGPVVDRLAEILGVLQGELEVVIQGGGAVGPQAPSKMEIERTMVLVVTCFRQIMKHHSFDVEEQKKPVYPDPCLLHSSWTVHIFDLELAKDLKCGLEVIATIQTFLDVRASALPRLARARRQERETQFQSESTDEFGSLGIDFTTAEVLALGGMETTETGTETDPVEELDQQFAEIIENVISPKIYRLLSDMLPPVPEDEPDKRHEADRLMFISKLTLCWSDCASVLVVEHQKLDWDTFIAPFGRQSWARLGDERGRVQVGLHFMLNVAQLDPGAFVRHPEDFTALLFQTIGTDKLTIEHKYLSNLLRMASVGDHPLLAPLFGIPELERQLDRAGFMEIREEVLCAIFNVIPGLLRSQRTSASMKSFVYRCINFFVSSLVSYDKAIHSNKVIHKQSYRAFVDATLGDLKRLAGEFITPLSVPGLKYFAKG